MKCANLLADEEDWTGVLDPVFCQDAAAVELLARILFKIKTAIDSGPEGAMRASRTLQQGIELMYLHTQAHQSALKLYVFPWKVT